MSVLLESILKKIFGDPNAKELKNIQVIVDKINALEPEMQALSSANLAVCRCARNFAPYYRHAPF